MIFYTPEFLVLFFIAVVILTLRARKKRGGTILLEKQIAIMGKQLVAFLSKETPLICLLADGRFFGDDYKDKDIPVLPHEEACRCAMKEIVRRSREMFPEKTGKGAPQESDIGQLSQSDARYYRYILIARHPDASEPLNAEYSDLAMSVKISPDFGQQVASHLTAIKLPQGDR